MKKTQCTVCTIKITQIRIDTFSCLLNQNTIFLIIKAHMVGKGLIKGASQTLMIRSKSVYSDRGTIWWYIPKDSRKIPKIWSNNSHSINSRKQFKTTKTMQRYFARSLIKTI